MTALLFSLPGSAAVTALVGQRLGAETGILDTRRFPDGETYLRFVTELKGRDVVLVCGLERPDTKFLPLIFAADTARDLGARSVGLVAPYLAYMRQDRRFKPGESITSRSFARLVSETFDWLVTIDPHLHRYHDLTEIYSIPAQALHAAAPISAWVKANAQDAILIGPDSESRQWVSAVAADAGVPFTVLEKIRRGDRDVEIRLPQVDVLSGCRPVLLDDIISSGRTMLEAVRRIKPLSPVPPLCIGVHGIFADNSDTLLIEAGAEIITTNTVPHASNRIDISPLLAGAVAKRLSAKD